MVQHIQVPWQVHVPNWTSGEMLPGSIWLLGVSWFHILGALPEPVYISSDIPSVLSSPTPAHSSSCPIRR